MATYNETKKTCDRCGITEEEHDKKYPWSPWAWARHPYADFYLDTKGGVLCGKCKKEKGLEELFNLMDKKEAQNGKQNQ